MHRVLKRLFLNFLMCVLFAQREELPEIPCLGKSDRQLYCSDHVPFQLISEALSILNRIRAEWCGRSEEI